MLGNYLKKGNFCNTMYLNSTVDTLVIELKNIPRYPIRGADEISEEIKSSIEDSPTNKIIIDSGDAGFIDTYFFSSLWGLQHRAQKEGKEVEIYIRSDDLNEIMDHCSYSDTQYRKIINSFDIPEDVQTGIRELKAKHEGRTA